MLNAFPKSTPIYSLYVVDPRKNLPFLIGKSSWIGAINRWILLAIIIGCLIFLGYGFVFYLTPTSRTELGEQSFLLFLENAVIDFAVICFAPIGTPLLMALWLYRRDRRLSRGHILIGRVIHAQRTRIWAMFPTLALYIDYEFETPNGVTIKNTKLVERNDILSRPLPPQGTPIAILYVNDRLYRPL